MGLEHYGGSPDGNQVVVEDWQVFQHLADGLVVRQQLNVTRWTYLLQTLRTLLRRQVIFVGIYESSAFTTHIRQLVSQNSKRAAFAAPALNFLIDQHKWLILWIECESVVKQIFPSGVECVNNHGKLADEAMSRSVLFVQEVVEVVINLFADSGQSKLYLAQQIAEVGFVCNEDVLGGS